MPTTALIRTEECSKGFPKCSENNRVVPTAKKILVIDDQWNTPLFSALQQQGYEVMACESPQKAWGMVWRFRPHFIIVRLTNPSRADISTLQGCCVLAGGIPVIIATSMSRNEPAIGVLEEWAEALLSLPVRPDAIRKILDELEPSDRDSGKRALAVSKN